jgi:phosphoglycolate phosphatase
MLIARNELKSAVYVGDTASDAQSAIDAGIPFVYAAYGFGSVDTWDYKINAIKELPQILEAD